MKNIKKLIVFSIFLILVTAGATYWYTIKHEEHILFEKLLTVQQELIVTKQHLIGYTKYTDYVTESKKAITEKMKFLAADVEREYTHIEHVVRGVAGFESSGAVIVKYQVDYSFGYDLKPGNFSISGDKTGLIVTLSKPALVATPAVRMISHEIISKGFFTDEKAAIINIQQQLHTLAKMKGNQIKKEEAVISLCEKKFQEFLVDFLSKQPGVEVIPTIKFVYK